MPFCSFAAEYLCFVLFIFMFSTKFLLSLVTDLIYTLLLSQVSTTYGICCCQPMRKYWWSQPTIQHCSHFYSKATLYLLDVCFTKKKNNNYLYMKVNTTLYSMYKQTNYKARFYLVKETVIIFETKK